MNLDELLELVEVGRDNEVLVAISSSPSLLHATTSAGENVLHMACKRKRAALVEPLIELGASVDGRGHVGRTPLDYVMWEGDARSVPIVEVLVRAGADPALRDDNGFTAADWARQEIDDPEARKAVLALLALARPPPNGLRNLFDAVLEHVGASDSTRDATESALIGIGEAFRLAKPMNAEVRIPGDVQASSALLDVVRVLDELSRSSWGAPLRWWLSHQPPEDHLQEAALEHVSGELARAGGRTPEYEREMEGLRNRFGIGNAASASPDPSHEAARGHVHAIERVAQTVAVIDGLRQAFCEGATIVAQPKEPTNADVACIRGAEQVLRALQSTSLRAPVRTLLSRPRVSGSTQLWVYRYFAFSKSD